VTQLVAVVETDLSVPDQITALRVRTLRADADVEEELSSQTVMLGASSDFPVAVAVEPFDLMDIGRVVVEVEAQSATGLRVVAQRAATEFRSGQVLALPMSLSSGCRRVMCPTGSTCAEMGCRSQEVAVDSLVSFEGALDAP